MKGDKKTRKGFRMNWKLIAIVFIVLFVSETISILWGIYLYEKEQEEWNVCLYEICSDYYYGEVEDGVCFCYDYDLIGNLKLYKTEILK